MTNKTTKRALFTSVMSLIICVVMLMGTTFAWFTDSVTSGRNTITAGNLDIELEYTATPDVADSWTNVKDSTAIFDDSALWEPGHTEVVYLRMKNVGTLDLKYHFGMNIAEETPATNVYGKEFNLSTYLKYGFVDYTAKFATRAEAIDAVKDSAVALDEYNVNGTMLNGTEKVMALVVYMPETVGNEANYRGTDIPTIQLGIDLFATQLESEEDSFGPDYDAGAPWVGGSDLSWYTDDSDAEVFVIDTPAELAGFAEIVNGTAVVGSTFAMRSTPVTVQDTFEGQTVTLGADIDLNGYAWTPIGQPATSSTDFSTSFRGTFDGQGYTVANLKVTNEGWSGLFGLAYKATLKNVTIVNADITSNRLAGALCGQLYGSIEDCHAKNVTINVTPNSIGENKFDNGDKVGGLVGWLGDNNNNRTVTDCSVEKAVLKGYRDIGGIVGYVSWSTTFTGNSVKGISITVDQTINSYGYKDYNAGPIWGRNSVSSTGVGVLGQANEAAEGEFAATATYIKDGSTIKDSLPDKTSLFYLADANAEGTINVPEGVTAIGGYAFAYNENIDKIVLPSSVKTLNDRAFRDTSAKEVVLNEGLTNISYQAFRNATNVESVVIPSTVTSIAKEAFQNSGVKTLVVPANVTTLEYGCMRDMKMLESVVIEGNVTIPVYAFRACTNLKTVIIKGDDVNFGGRGMIFTNLESGNGTAITVYVANETVKDRLLANDTAAKDYGGYEIVVGNPTASTVTDVKEKLAGGEDVFLANDVTVSKSESGSNGYGASALSITNGQTFDGNGNTVYAPGANGTWDSAINITSGTIRNVTVASGFRGIFINKSATNDSVYLENVVIDGPVYTISCDSASEQGVVAKNCTFNGWTSYAGTIGTASFTDCSFGEGSGYAYCRPYAPTTFVGCDFEAGYVFDARAAVTFENCTIGGVALTAENLSTLVIYNIANATVK